VFSGPRAPPPLERGFTHVPWRRKTRTSFFIILLRPRSVGQEQARLNFRNGPDDDLASLYFRSLLLSFFLAEASRYRFKSPDNSRSMTVTLFPDRPARTREAYFSCSVSTSGASLPSARLSWKRETLRQGGIPSAYYLSHPLSLRPQLTHPLNTNHTATDNTARGRRASYSGRN
jgi:hypothetical protein